MVSTPRLSLSPPSLFRALTGLAAIGLLFPAWQGHLSAAGIGATLASALLLLFVRLNPVARTPERALTFAAPVVFALTLWLGPGVAMAAALLTYTLHARFGPGTRKTRRDLRFQGTRLAVAAWFGGAALTLSARGLMGLTEPLAAPLGLSLLAAAVFGALSFTGAYLLLTLGGGRGALRAFLRGARTRRLQGARMLVYGLGMLPILLLAPLGGTLGLVLALPLTVLLFLSAQVARMNLEIASLRGQLETAQAMGRASIADPTDTDAPILLQRFLALAEGLVEADRALVWICEQETGILTPIVGLPDLGVFEGQQTAFGEGLIGHSLLRAHPRLVADAARDPRRGRREAASGAWLLYPLIAHEQMLGVAQWIRPTSRPFSQEDVTRLAALVPQAAVALENVRIREEIGRLAATDGLTGLWNHRRMHELLREEMRRGTRYHRALSVLMLDVDSFKTFNDTYGHPQGDELLRGIAAILRSNVRTVDFVGRYGGEEFLVILPETYKDDACRMAERIRSAVEENAFIVVEGRAIRRTVSVGVASYPEDALNPGELVQRADEALYRAKRAGKNRVIWA